MIVLDTHAWLWHVAAPTKLGRAARAAIASADVLGVSAVSAWELATLVRKKRLELDRPVSEWIAEALAADRIEELPLTAEIALVAGSFGDDFRGDHADRMIAATALRHGAMLVTKDATLRAMSTLSSVW